MPAAAPLRMRHATTAMLSVPAFAQVDGISIFRDDEDPTRFYYLPRAPRLAQGPDGKPQFTFLRYQFPVERETAEPGGGYLVFTTVMGEDPGILETKVKPLLQARVRAELPPSVAMPEIMIAPVDFTDGSVRLIIMQDNKFVKAINLGKPSLFADNSASVAVELSANAAILFYEALKLGGSIAAIEYDLVFPVRLPAITIIGHIDCKEVVKAIKAYSLETVQKHDVWGTYEETEQKTTAIPQIMESQGLITLQILKGSVDISNEEMESLRSWAFAAMDGFIKEHFLKGFTASTEAERKQLLIEYQESDIGTITGEFDINVSYRDVISRNYNPSAQINPSFLGIPIDQVVLDIDLNNAPWYFNNLDVQVDTNFDFEKYGDIVHSVVGHLTYDEPGPDGTRLTKRESLMFTKDDRTPKSFKARLVGVGRDTYHVTTEVNYKAGPVLQAVVQRFDTTVRHLTLNVPNPGVVEVQFSAAPEAFGERLQSIEVDVEYGDTRNNVPLTQETVILSAPAPTKTYRRVIYAKWEKPFRYRCTYVLTDDEGNVQRSTTDWHEASSSTRFVNVPTPFDEVFTLNVIPQIDWSEMREVVVDLEYDDENNDYHMRKTISFSKDANKMSIWKFLLRDPDKRSFRYKETFLYQNNAIEEKEWQTRAQDGAITIGNAPYGVAVVSVDPADIGVGSEVKRAIVRLCYLDESDPAAPREDTAALLFRDGNAQDWAVTLGKTQTEYTYDVTYIMNDNSQRSLVGNKATLDRRGKSYLFIPPPPTA